MEIRRAHSVGISTPQKQKWRALCSVSSPLFFPLPFVISPSPLTDAPFSSVVPPRSVTSLSPSLVHTHTESHLLHDAGNRPMWGLLCCSNSLAPLIAFQRLRKHPLISAFIPLSCCYHKLPGCPRPMESQERKGPRGWSSSAITPC